MLWEQIQQFNIVTDTRVNVHAWKMLKAKIAMFVLLIIGK